jgi:hypothetical protein
MSKELLRREKRAISAMGLTDIARSFADINMVRPSKYALVIAICAD